MVLAAFHKFSLLTTQSTKQQQRQQRSTGNKSLSLESTIFDERDIEILIQNLVAKHLHDNDNDGFFQSVVDDDDEAMVRNLEASDSDCGGLAGVLDVVVGQMMLFAGKGDYVIYYYYYYC
jgi:hypothetical protein